MEKSEKPFFKKYFSGYIPRMPFKFGGTYKDDCDICIDEYTTNRQVHDFKNRDLTRQVSSVPRLTAISHDPYVKEYLDRYRDTHPNRPLLMGMYKQETQGFCLFVLLL